MLVEELYFFVFVWMVFWIIVFILLWKLFSLVRKELWLFIGIFYLFRLRFVLRIWFIYLKFDIWWEIGFFELFIWVVIDFNEKSVMSLVVFENFLIVVGLWVRFVLISECFVDDGWNFIFKVLKKKKKLVNNIYYCLVLFIVFNIK